MSLFGKDMTFYTLLEGQAATAVASAQAFQSLCGNFGQAAQFAQQAQQLETEADDLWHQLIAKVDSTFVTPMDKDDLHALSTALEDVIDNIEAAIARVALYRVPSVNAGLPPLVDLLLQATQAINEAVGSLRHLHDRNTVDAAIRRIHDIINDSDREFRQAIANLFNASTPDPILVMKWSQIYDRIETAVDKCEVAADILGSVVIKYA